jgi:glycosyltransferase involved in cell wall biosynthesis
MGPIFDPTGYADEGRGLVCALDRVGVPVALRPPQRATRGFRETLHDAERSQLDRMLARALPPRSVLVQHQAADSFNATCAAPYLVGRTMFESDALPASWVARCNAMDELWLPSRFNVETFRRAGVRVPMHVVPGGIDCAAFRPDVEPYRVAGVRGTVFLSVFEWRLRKGWDVLLEAWAEAFEAGDEVSLVLRSYPIGCTDGRDNATVLDERIDAFLRDRCGRTRRDVAPIIVLGEKVPASRMAGLYAMADAYVLPTRGEGWGRPFMEAMACGVPVIATRWSAHLEFMHDENAYLIDVDGLVPADDVEMPIYAGQRWAQPSVPHLAALLRRVHGDRAEAKALGARARREMARDWPWSRAASVIEARLREIGGRPPFSAAPRGASGTSRRRPEARVTVDAPLFARSGWPRLHEPLVAALADLRGDGLGVVNRETNPQRPSYGVALASAWWAAVRTAEARAGAAAGHVDAPAACSTPASARLVILDRGDPAPPSPPRDGRWIVHTGDVVADAVPGGLVRALRDQADAVWVPTAAAEAACLAVGVDPGRLWRVPAWRVVDDLPADGAALHVHARAATLVVAPFLDARQGPAYEALLRQWDRLVGPEADIQLVAWLPPVRDRSTAAWRQHLLALLASGRLCPHGHPLVDATSGSWDTVPPLLRAADVLLDCAPMPASILTWRMAQAVGRPIITLDTPDGRETVGSDAGWLVAREANGRPSRAALAAALADATDPARRARAGAAARIRATGHASLAEVATMASDRLSALCAGARRALPAIPDWDALPLLEPRALVVFAHADWHAGTAAAIVRAFAMAIDGDAPVTLAVCLDPSQGVGLEDAAAQVETALALAAPGARPDVLLVPDPVDDALRARLLARCDAVVALDDAPLRASARALGRAVIDTLAPTAWQEALGPMLQRTGGLVTS